MISDELHEVMQENARLRLELQQAQKELQRLRAAVDDFFEPEPESVRKKNIDAIMEAFRTGKKPKRIEMTPEEIASAEKNFAAFDRLKAFSRYADEAAERAQEKS